MPIITISRGSLSGGGLLAEELGKKLDYSVISREVIVEAAKKYGVAEVDIQEGLEVPPGLWARLTHNRDRYILAVQATLATMVQKDNCVYHGYCGQLLLKDLPSVVKVRLIAPEEYRIKAAMAKKGVSRDVALEQISTVDEQREKWVHSLYGEHWADPSLYDIVINLAHVTVPEAVELVTSLVQQKQKQATEAEQRQVDNFALVTRIRAALTFESEFPESEIDIQVEDGRVDLRGTFAARNRPELTKFVSSIEGVKRIVGVEEKFSGDAGPLSEEKTAGDLMLPLDRYPHIHQGATIREAMVAMGASTVQLPDGHIMHPRYILVFDNNETLVGLVNRRHLFMGLLPQFKNIARAQKQAVGVMPPSMLMDTSPLSWTSLFSPAARNHAEDPVLSVMHDIVSSVNVDDQLSTVLNSVIHKSVDLLPVKEGNRVVGVILMTELFDQVAGYIIEGE